MNIPSKNMLSFIQIPDIWLVGGLDEAHYSGAAGSMWVGYVIARADTDWRFVKDSKLLSTEQIKHATFEVLDKALFVIVKKISVDYLDSLKKGESQKAILGTMRACVRDTTHVRPDFLFIDAHVLDGIYTPQFGPIQGDSKYKIIGAASCMAKYRNILEMWKLDEKYPEYDFPHNRGYYTKKHHAAAMKYGLIPGVHRRNWCHTWEKEGAKWRKL